MSPLLSFVEKGENHIYPRLRQKNDIFGAGVKLYLSSFKIKYWGGFSLFGHSVN